jgi:SPP1 family predicted phage head-tail adaptor
MAAGKYRHRVTIEQKTETKNEFGTRVPSWVALATVWARVDTLNGNEKYVSARHLETASVVVEIRYRADITAAMRVVYGPRTLEISAVIDVGERRRELKLLCKELN